MIPEIVFIIPYRDRFSHRVFFTNYMKIVLEDYKEGTYEIYFAHQRDERPFNRGAMKNIGFLAMKRKYPDRYKNITFVFNDVDTVPYDKGVFDYQTTHGVVKHFYGFKFCLGGCFSIKGADFERTNGFPNLWFWGDEDTIMNDRSVSQGIIIDRSKFYPIGHPAVLQLFDGMKRLCSRLQNDELRIDKGTDGLTSLYRVEAGLDGQDINVTSFATGTSHENQGVYHQPIADARMARPRVGMMPRIGR
jgi:hypothetical protein